jgi:hypothetical protein
MRILYDGWSLVHQSCTPASLHLLSILENLPAEIIPLVALPEPAPDWFNFPDTILSPTPATPWGRLRWQQSRLPSLAKASEAQIIHLATPTAHALINFTTIFSPTGFGAGTASGPGIQHASDVSKHVLDRMRISLGLGGLERASAVIWPSDLPAPHYAASLTQLAPIIPAIFIPPQGLEEQGVQTILRDDAAIQAALQLPDEFILYQGPGGEGDLETLLQAWRWASVAVGELYPMLLVGLDDNDQRFIRERSKLLGLDGSLLVLSGVTPASLSWIYERCSAVFHPGPVSPWSGPARLAIASGKPLVATEQNLTAAITGPAAYLVRENDARALGAALVTVVVEHEMADRLSIAAKQRSQAWSSHDFRQQIMDVYSKARKVATGTLTN